MKRRLSYLAEGVRLISPLQIFMHPRAGSPLQRALEQRPQLAGAVIWPYICTSWDARTRLQRIDEHFRVIESMAVLDFPVNEQMALIDLADVAANLRVVLDQPKWFMREGMLVLNLFAKDARIYSLAFSFALERDKVVAHVGAIQGVGTEGIMDEYKSLTKALHGMRPRDFQVELLRIFCRCLGVSRIYAVADDKRQHRSSYFGAAKSDVLFLNYNTIWEERGGVRDSEDFFVLPMETPMKSLDKVPSRKRAMYRRRYELLQSLEKRMQVALNMNPMASFLICAVELNVTSAEWRFLSTSEPSTCFWFECNKSVRSKKPRLGYAGLTREGVHHMTIAVIGLGYIGLPLVIEFGKQTRTLGLDLSLSKVESCKRGVDPSRELTNEEMRSAVHAEYTNDPIALSEADFIIVAVPTPVDVAHRPDFTPLIGASASAGRHMKKGAIVIYESTVYPGATEEVCIPVIERESGLKWKRDFFVGYSPERINPGDREHTLDHRS